MSILFCLLGGSALFYELFPACPSTSSYFEKKQMSNKEENGEIMRLNVMTFVFIPFHYQ
ncbi:hypothetical protein HMPREF0083_02236 [Aneurinibacillus aneurinilyticus ATCC 12856]|uniref:Uncharacterized protein n=1 Tax=Aneurinibacillus aneurinilyticus ATCC 12856 TaxID=649747 RepID=U1YC99_ANEAE|nr:hypothetical protein HMPREF0083_02236 [Aneurinibacillus aneurinilyticus ATCC 12856]